MLKDIWFVGPRRLAMKKKLFAEHELSLARCLNLEVDIHNMVVYAQLETTTKRALFEFLSECFRSLMHNEDQKHFREQIFEKLSNVYDEIFNEFYSEILIKAGYQDKLMEHQRHALATMIHKKYNFLAFVQGLGKTITSATISKILNLKRTLIVCPSLVKWNWFRDLTEGKNWKFNELYFSILDRNKSKCVIAFQERFIIVNYEMINNFYEHITREPIDHIIIDEATYIKNHSSNRFKALKNLIEQYPNARVTLLSGTPVKNRVSDLFAYLKLCGHELGSNYSMFLRDFTNSTSGRGGRLRIGTARNIKNLYQKTSNFMIRRTKEECLDLPSKIIYKYRFELDDYRKEYNNVISEMAKQKNMTNLHSCLHSLNIVLTKAKLNGVIEMANAILDQGRKVIIFSGYKEPLNQLETHFGDKCVKIDGSVAAHERDNRIQSFLHNDNVTVFLGNMIAAGVGINLVNCSDVIFTNFPFTPSELYQAEDRTHRIGQKNSVNIYYTICSDSIDEYLYNLICEKAADINALIDRGKEVTDMGDIPEKLFKRLIEEYRKENPESIEDDKAKEEKERITTEEVNH